MKPTDLTFKVLSAFLLALSSLACPAADPVDLASQLQSRYSELNTALGSGDGALLRKLLAPDYTLVRGDGSIGDRNSMLAALTATGNDATASSITVQSVTDQGSSASVIQTTHVSAQRTKADGSPLAAAGDLQVTDTWINASGTWLLKQSVVGQYAYTLNGKSVSR